MQTERDAPQPRAVEADPDAPPLDLTAPLIGRGEPIADAVRAALLDQAAACAALAVCAAGRTPIHIHALRKRTRQTRALVRLVGGCLVGDKVVKQALRDLAGAARLLSDARDAEVLPDALALLPLPLRSKTPQLALALAVQRAAAAVDPRHAENLRIAAVAIAEATRGFAALLPVAVLPRVLIDGLRSALARVRACRKQARKRPRPEAIHDLRKACKDLRHQLEWLGVDGDHELYAELVSGIKALGELTDLFALDQWLRNHGRSCPQAETAAVGRGLERAYARTAGKLIGRCKDLLPDKPRTMAPALLAELGW
ncbi:MAG: CHAD domain-containing protein [Deltaproteobacteria bacterium]|nr:CHAD domain-containing protein [Deltaproteobacteria bacterium]